MRKFLSAAALTASLLAGTAIATPAAAINFVGNFSVTQYQSGESNGLEIELSRENGGLNFNLNSAGFANAQTVKLFDIWAGEDIDSNNNHNDERDFKVLFNFSQPDFDGSVQGETQGVFRPGNSDYATLEWDGDNIWSFGFGNGGVFKVFLTDAEFGQGSNRDDEVHAKFWIDKMPTAVSAVPEPGTWALMITGFGLAGAALRRKRHAAAMTA